MQRALEQHYPQQQQQQHSREQQGRRVRPFASDAAAGTPASEAATIGDVISTPVTIGDAINTPVTIGDVISTPVGPTEDDGLAPSPLSLLGRLPAASQVSTAKSTAPAGPTSTTVDVGSSDRLAAAEREIHALRRQIAAAGARAEEERTELQYQAAEHQRAARVLTAELAAAAGPG